VIIIYPAPLMMRSLLMITLLMISSAAGRRVIIISPLFGIALMVKETLARWFP
jgi:hypothetical protein